MSALIPIAAALVLGAVAGYLAGRLSVSGGGGRTPDGDEDRLRRQVRDLSAELRAVREELAQETATAGRIPFIVKKLGERMPEEAIPGIAVRIVKDFLRTPKAGFLRLKPEGGVFVLEEGIGFRPEWKGTRTFSASVGILGAAVKQHIVMGKEDYLGGRSEWPAPASSLEEAGVFPDLVAPIVWGGHVYGMLFVAGSPVPLGRKRPYISMLADMVAGAVQSSITITRKAREASTDQLTGLYNRAHFNAGFATELRNARETVTPLSVLLFDIDRFKSVNDTHGHPAGDVVLRRIADIVLKSSRATDTVARYGGEEFVVVMGATDKDQAFACAERLRQTIAKSPLEVPGLDEPLQVTVSIGVSGFPEDGDSTDDLVKAADDALYEAKKTGRNRVVRAARVGIDGKPF